MSSQTKTEKAQKDGKFKNEIVPVVLKSKKGDSIFKVDEHPRAGMTIETLTRLNPAFKKDGTVTAGNASGINDGAAAVVLMNQSEANKKKFRSSSKNYFMGYMRRGSFFNGLRTDFLHQKKLWKKQDGKLVI